MKKFLAKDKSGRMPKSVTLGADVIYKYWDLNETSWDDVSLETYLKECEEGDEFDAQSFKLTCIKD
jgi:hypothetical protein